MLDILFGTVLLSVFPNLTRRDMNKKIGIMLVIAVSVLLPAVAVAEVMVNGNISVSATSVSSTIQVHKGPNYDQVYDVEDSSIQPTVSSASEYFLKLDTEFISNETVWAVNFLYVTFSTSYTGPGWFNISVSSSNFGGTGSLSPILYFLPNTISGMTFSDITPSVASSVYSLPLTSGATVSIQFSSVPSEIDIGMMIPADLSTSDGAILAMTFTQ